MGKQAIDAPRGATTFNVDPQDLVLVGLDAVDGKVDGPEHPLYDKRVSEPADMALVESILDVGILEPVIIWRNGSRMEVAAGRRRTLAARKANEILEERYDKAHTEESKRKYVRVPSLARTGDEKLQLKTKIVENAIRKDLSLLQSAKEIQDLVNRGFTEQELATSFGCTQQTIKNRLALLSCAKQVHKAIEQNQISATAAIKLAPLSHDEQIVELERMLAEGVKTGVEAARAARNRKAANADGGQATSYERPGVRLLRKVCEHEIAPDALDPLVLKTIRWMLGELSPTSIKGLSPLIAKIEEGE